MMVEVGDTLRSLLTGRTYQVEKLVERFAVLGGIVSFNKVYTEIESLGLLYERVETERERTGLETQDPGYHPKLPWANGENTNRDETGNIEEDEKEGTSP